MNKIFEQILKQYKRASRVARQKMIERYGFKTEAEFLIYLKAEPKVEAKAQTYTDMVIAFDTTGSMTRYIDAVRKHVETTIDALFENVPNLRLKIVAFGDYCDMIDAKTFGNAYQEIPLTDNKKALIKFVKEAKRTSGGDTDEFYELVIKKVVEETEWRKEAKKAMLLIADYTPHEVGYSLGHWVKNAQIDWRQEAQKAKAASIQIDTLRILPNMTWYQELSDITGGTCINFQTSEKTADIMEASTYFRGSSASVDSVKVKYRAAKARGDEELVGAYKEMAFTHSIDLDK